MARNELLRRNDGMKRATSSTCIVESVEYMTNHSSHIRQYDGSKGTSRKKLTQQRSSLRHARSSNLPTTNTIGGLFLFFFLNEKMDQRKVAYFSLGLMAAYVVLHAVVNIVHLPPQQPNLVWRLDDLQSTENFYINYKAPFLKFFLVDCDGMFFIICALTGNSFTRYDGIIYST